jgi:hypothetical protein
LTHLTLFSSLLQLHFGEKLLIGEENQRHTCPLYGEVVHDFKMLILLTKSNTVPCPLIFVFFSPAVLLWREFADIEIKLASDLSPFNGKFNKSIAERWRKHIVRFDVLLASYHYVSQ